MTDFTSAYTRSTAQHTLNRPITFHGKGVHSDLPVVMTLHPSGADTGIQFTRLCDDGSEIEIPATYDAVGATELCTIIGDPKGVFVATIEHLMAALRAFSLDNVRIEIDGPEVPVMDGSAYNFVTAIEEAGLMAQTARRRYIRIEKTIRVDMGSSFGELTPYNGCRFDVEIDFSDPVIGRQRFTSDITTEVFCNQIARARTFGFMRDVEKLWEAGYALGSSLENSVVIGDEGVINPDGLRYADEFVRHKLLDAFGDLALSGLPILGSFRSYRGGHKLNFLMLKALFENRESWSYVETPAGVNAGTGRVGVSAEPAMALAPIKD